MIALRVPSIASAKIDVTGESKRVLTVYTPLATEMGSPDWEEFYRLRTRLQILVEPLLGGYDEVRIEPLDATEKNDRSLVINALGDPVL
jgi:hypothetical protein